MSSYPAWVTRRQESSATQMAAAWVGGAPPSIEPIAVVAADAAWAERFADEADRLRAVLPETAISIEHVGSTSVPGLAAKPIIDIDLVVADSEAEERYAPALATAGYELVLREPWWNGHRLFVRERPAVNLHVFPLGAAEPIRHILFRDWLRTHPDDRERYARMKETLAEATRESPEDYNLAKNAVIDEIYDRIFDSPPDVDLLARMGRPDRGASGRTDR